jgi:hypothetical protein
MQNTIVKLMSAPVNGWMAICGQHFRFMGIVGRKF